ncbi:MAG: hypothetical protein IK082_10360 [Oscillospiraceae bacterium]|nr:hypothetical protein [Oscillospiraceae bacterium]
MLIWEIRKLCTRFTLLALLILFVLNGASVLLVYGGDGGERGRTIREARDELLDEYLNDRSAYEADLAAYREKEDAYEDWIWNGDGAFVWVNDKVDLEGYGDRALWRDVNAEIERAESYNADLARALREAYARLRDLGDRRGEYAYEYQVNVILRYEALADMMIEPQNIYGWNEFFSLAAPAVFLTLAMILLGAQVFLGEKQARFTGILHVARYGEARTRAAKICALFLCSAVLTAVFSLTPLLILYFTTGLSDPSQVVEALRDFEFCPAWLTIRDALFITLAVRTAVVFALSLAAACVGSLTGSVVLTGGVMLVFLGISAVSKQGYFTAALVRFFFERYRAVNLFGILVDSELFCGVLVGLVLVLGIAGTMCLKMNPREFRFPEKIKNAAREFGGKIRLPVREKPFASHSRSLFRWELYKMLGRPGVALMLVLLFLLRLAMQNSFFTPSVSRDEAAYRAYIADLTELGGRADKVTDDYIAEESAYLARAEEEYRIGTEDFRAGTITSGEFSEISGRKNYASSVQGGFAKVLERQAYLKGTSMRYENLGYADDDGMKKLLRPGFDLVFAAAILLLFSDLFAGERQSGFAAIQRTAKRGRAPTFRAKLAAALSVTAVLWLVFTISDLWMLTSRFPLYGLGFGLKSIPDFAGGDWNPPLWVSAVLTKLAGLSGALLLSCIAAGCSALSPHTAVAASVLFVVLIGPYLTSALGLGVFDAVSAKPLFAPNLPEDLMNMAGWALLAGILLLPAAVRWNGIKRR